MLLFGVIVGLVGWMNEAHIRHAYRLYWIEARFALANMRPLTVEAEKALRPDPDKSFRECIGEAKTDICPEMVVVPAGLFDMGSPDTERDAPDYDEYAGPREFPQHKVTIAKPFAVSKYELTFAEWDICVEFGDCPPRSMGAGLDDGFGRGRQPAIFAGWEDAQRYVAWLSRVTGEPYRLLTEAEYEYAARGGVKPQTRYPWGDGPWGDGSGKNNANCNGCFSQWDNRQTAPVGSFAPNKFGLYDMVGNLWEWVEDCEHPNYKHAPNDGSAWITGDACSMGVLRGGSFVSSPGDIRSAARGRATPATRQRSFGFRVARTLSTEANTIPAK